MAWRGSTTVWDRIFASLAYLLPLVDVVGLLLRVGIQNTIFGEFPALRVILVPLLPLVQIYFGIPFVGLIIFFVLFLLVVRNERVSHFIRFNTMQAILITIALFLCSILVQILAPIPGATFAIATIVNTIFLGVFIAAAYAVIQSLLGRYAEIPAISDAVYMQVR
ncbi:Tic20 family protein [Gloeocapsa sp. BRSZ]